MSSVISGTNTNSDRKLSPWEQKDDLEDCWDPEKLQQCPYDPSHKIRACRIPYHFIKCRKNHPELANQLKTCPFNARHLMPKHELPHHIANCVNKCALNIDDVSSTEMLRTFMVPVNTWTSPVVEQDWDVEEKAGLDNPPFVWGISTSQIVQNSNLTPGVRAPKTLPWKQGQDL